MISSKKLVALARKWKTMAGIGRRTIAIPSINPKLAKAGHFVVYSLDEGRFVVPLAYLRTNVFKELFRLSEEEFGLPRDGPITLPCDAAVLEYVISMVQRHDSDMLEKALLVLLGSQQCYSTIASQELC
ncbi:SMALL AUXIN UPREGULATED RNA 66 [Hibiscus trionum]|uniref:SMALL AUXIN UPREGULATED RNA 66 n=1 Tax=Hibiscus trionum TaxID=183268 RepID=A0A9W7I6I4_HIBTR|nr:SMALL AUXIN UPREGULATED RNA 66 [Hibiscus trionum]